MDRSGVRDSRRSTGALNFPTFPPGRRGPYEAGLHVIPSGRTARLVEVDGSLVTDSDNGVTDDDVLGLLDTGRP